MAMSTAAASLNIRMCCNEAHDCRHRREPATATDTAAAAGASGSRPATARSWHAQSLRCWWGVRAPVKEDPMDNRYTCTLTFTCALSRWMPSADTTSWQGVCQQPEWLIRSERLVDLSRHSSSRCAVTPSMYGSYCESHVCVSASAPGNDGHARCSRGCPAPQASAATLLLPSMRIACGT